MPLPCARDCWGMDAMPPVFSGGCFGVLARALLTKRSELPVTSSAPARCPLARTVRFALARLLGPTAVIFHRGPRAAEKHLPTGVIAALVVAGVSGPSVLHPSAMSGTLRGGPGVHAAASAFIGAAVAASSIITGVPYVSACWQTMVRARARSIATAKLGWAVSSRRCRTGAARIPWMKASRVASVKTLFPGQV